jgi:hypothetical protein
VCREVLFNALPALSVNLTKIQQYYSYVLIPRFGYYMPNINGKPVLNVNNL